MNGLHAKLTFACTTSFHGTFVGVFCSFGLTHFSAKKHIISLMLIMNEVDVIFFHEDVPNLSCPVIARWEHVYAQLIFTLGNLQV